MEKQLYFEHPVQIKFLDFDGCEKDHLEWKGGIAFADTIICGCCGGTFYLDDLYDDWEDWAQEEFGSPEVTSPLVVYDYWVDLSEEIVGE